MDNMSYDGAIVVGIGDKGEELPEVRWAAREASLRNRPLRLIRAYDLTAKAFPWDNGTDRMITSQMRAAALRRVRTALRVVQQDYPDLDATGDAVHAAPWLALCEAAATAELTVVGSRRHGTLGSAVLGSVSSLVAARGPGPVVVAANPPGDPADDLAVVVGVDGSAVTDDVLGFAFDYASVHARRLHAVFCWPHDLLADMKWRGEPPAPERAERWLAEATAGWQDKYPDVPVTRAVVRAAPTMGLVTQSFSQELVVVGSHSKHPRVSSFLGSVSQGVLHHATCPVAVVHPRAAVE
jgi:nucleotide-binding universal stress UspA family protein